jgi:hypothetical protein
MVPVLEEQVRRLAQAFVGQLFVRLRAGLGAGDVDVAFGLSMRFSRGPEMRRTPAGPTGSG